VARERASERRGNETSERSRARKSGENKLQLRENPRLLFRLLSRRISERVSRLRHRRSQNRRPCKREIYSRVAALSDVHRDVYRLDKFGKQMLRLPIPFSTDEKKAGGYVNVTIQIYNSSRTTRYHARSRSEFFLPFFLLPSLFSPFFQQQRVIAQVLSLP